MAVCTFNFYGGLCGPYKCSVGVDVKGCVAVLAKHAFAHVDVWHQMEIVLGVEGRWFGFVGHTHKWALETGFHKSLVADANSSTPVMAGRTGFYGDAGILFVVDMDFGFAGRLDRMD